MSEARTRPYCAAPQHNHLSRRRCAETEQVSGDSQGVEISDLDGALVRYPVLLEETRRVLGRGFLGIGLRRVYVLSCDMPYILIFIDRGCSLPKDLKGFPVHASDDSRLAGIGLRDSQKGGYI